VPPGRKGPELDIAGFYLEAGNKKVILLSSLLPVHLSEHTYYQNVTLLKQNSVIPARHRETLVNWILWWKCCVHKKFLSRYS
jgi:hypothetical protein